MNYKFKISVENIPNIFRVIKVNDGITYEFFFKLLLVSMNVDSKTLFYVWDERYSYEIDLNDLVDYKKFKNKAYIIRLNKRL